jgi:hypothetical protein
VIPREFPPWWLRLERVRWDSERAEHLHLQCAEFRDENLLGTTGA